MNERDYGSREACQRLRDAGIVVKTEAVWTYHKFSRDFFPEYGWELQFKDNTTVVGVYYLIVIPAPSMAEVWRELPETSTIRKEFGLSHSMIVDGEMTGVGSSVNPTDALIDLRIWIEQGKEKP